MTVGEIAEESTPAAAPGDRSRPATSRRLRVIVMVAAVLVLCGVAVLLAGPVRSVLQQGAAGDKATAVATDATCFRFRSLATAVAVGSVPPEEIRRRVSDLAIGAMGARSEVAVAGRDLAEVLPGGEAATGQALTETDPWVALAGICGS